MSRSKRKRILDSGDINRKIIRISHEIIEKNTNVNNIYQNLVVNSEEKYPESVHLCDYPLSDDSWIDKDLILKVDALKKCVELGRSARSKSKIKIRQPLSKVSYAIEDNKVAQFFLDNKDIILDELNVKSVERITEAGQLISYKIKPSLRTLGQKYGKGLSDIKIALNELEPNGIGSKIQTENKIILYEDNCESLGAILNLLKL